MKRPQPFAMETLHGELPHYVRWFLIYADEELQAVAQTHPGILDVIQTGVGVCMYHINPRFDAETVWLEIYALLEDAVQSGTYVELDHSIWGDI